MFEARAVWPWRGWIAILACAAAFAVGACIRSPEPDLALACQMRKCICKPADPAVFSKSEDKEVMWKQNGDAYCLKGHVLRKAE